MNRRGAHMLDLPRFATSPHHVRALDFGHILVLINYRSGHVQCLLPAAANLWRATAVTGDLGDMAPALAVRLLGTGLLIPTAAPRPWPDVLTAEPAPASWGSAEHLAGTDCPPHVPARSGIAAAAALATVFVVKHAGDDTAVMHRVITLLRAATASCRLAATPSQAEAAVVAVRYAGWYSPGRTACLEESAAAALLLASRRRAVIWCHGIASDPVRLHAWVQTVDGSPVAEPPSTLVNGLVVLPVGGQ
ncbi:lasso peptide biosynthesis B2 protein [Streptomyces sp. NPDC088554]|uniref:lasso peptide biosynthesis B2 protein n=1 Tax=Streptomyces sp. NPDC088554 TaxID=3365865 RepID=UPI003825AA23